ncbi:hypothetical protein H0H87_011584 [Tephrocybe sp. NHM501043]|nr:hypothetical protein H0H87_011584 [Tephrocybe sp. NHM501043]
MALTWQASATDKIFQELKSKDADRQLTAANELRRYLSATVPELSTDNAGKLWDDDINRRLFELTYSQHSHEAFGGLQAITQLLDSELAAKIDTTRNLFRFWNYIKYLLPKHDVDIMLLASQALGQIAKIGGDAFGESFVDKEVPAALEMILHEHTRHAGLLIIKELALNSLTFFYTHLDGVFKGIILPLRDSRLVVREAAAEVLAACLEVLTQRDRQPTNQYLPDLLLEAQAGLKQSLVNIIHGSLLIYRELLLHAGMAMHKMFLETAEQILLLKSHREPLIRKAVIGLIPSLAAYDTQSFTEHILQKVMAHLLLSTERPLEQSSAFLAIGYIAKAVRSDIKPFLEPIMGHIKQRLQGRGKSSSSEEPLFQCIAMLAAAVGPNLTKMVHDQIDLMFACGLTESLRQALVAITRHIPPLLNPIQHRLLNLIAGVLSGTQYTPLGSPSPTGRSRTISIPVPFATNSPGLVGLALQTLGSFDFSGHVLNEFVLMNALPYLDDDRPETRRAAAITCCRLLARDPISYQDSNYAVEMINDVLSRLLVVGVADPDASVRHTVLISLYERFDKHLAQAENVRTLFIVLNDEDFENRVVAVTLIGRLSRHNPAYVMPPLRKMLIQLLTELEYSCVLRSREECTRLLTLLISATQRLIKPYALSILRVLIHKASDVYPTVSANVLTALGELTCISGEDAMPFIPELIQIIIPCLAETASSAIVKRDAALHTLGQICSHTGYVIDPLADHPQLLELLGKILKVENNKPLRREVLKVLGILGAMDPYRHKIRPHAGLISETGLTAINVVPVNGDKNLSPSGDHVQLVVFTALLAILRDQTLSAQHVSVIEAIMTIFKTQGLKCVAFLPQIIPAFADATRSSPLRLGFYLEQLTILVSIVKYNIRNLVPDILTLITDLWTNFTMHLPIVTLIEGLGKVLDAEFKPFLPTVLPLMLEEFVGESTGKKSRTDTQIKVFDAFLAFGTNLNEYLQIVLPIIVASYERVDGTTLLRKKALQTIEGLSKQINFSEHASRIIHPLIRVLDNDSSSDELQMQVMDTLCALVLQLDSDFTIFIPSMHKTILKNGLSYPRYEELIHKILRGQPLPQTGALDAVDKENTVTATGLSIPAEATTLAVNQEHLKQDDLIKSIECAMASITSPPELVHFLLDLAEFMERKEKGLPIEPNTLGGYAVKVLAFAPALHYKELEFFSKPSSDVIESLISINARLQQDDAAWGTLSTANQYSDIKNHEEWYERLGFWQEALDVYTQKAGLHPGDPEVEIGRMKCLHALGEWDHLAAQVKETWPNASRDYRQEIAPMAAAAAWSLHEWDDMDGFIVAMKLDSSDHAFYRAILSVHQNQFSKALIHIAKARDSLNPELASVVGEGFGRSYK